MNNKTKYLKMESGFSAFESGIILIAMVFVTMFAVLLFVAIPNTSYAATYAYVNTSGVTTRVEANTSDGAFANSTNIATNSGVMRINSMSDSNLANNNVAGI